MKLFISKLIILFSVGLISGLRAQTLNLNLQQVPCNYDGVIVATASGFLPPITYNWIYDNQFISFTTNNLTDTIFNFAGGGSVYCFVGDTTSNWAWDTLSTFSPFTFSLTVNNPVCPAAIGSCSVSISGGQTPFTVDWKDYPNNTYVTSGPNVNLPLGNYYVYVTDGNGCTIIPDTAQVIQQSPLLLTVSTTTANCTNGTASITSVTGGLAPYTYLWSNGLVTSTISNLSSGSYNATVTDAQGCKKAAWAYVPQGTTINANVITTPATCLQNDGSAITFGSGGTPPYSYIYSNGQTSQNATGLTSGSYYVQVSDALSCNGSTGFFVSSSTPITVTYTAAQSSCTAPTGSATLTVSGGQMPYTVNWASSPPQTGTVLSNVPSGSYYFNVTDANGCIRSGTAYVPPVSNLSAWIGATPATCPNNNGSAFINSFSSFPPITYLWNTSATTSLINNLAPGGYTCVITDGVGCQLTKSVIVQSVSPINIGFNLMQATCIFTSDGAISTAVGGGMPPYTFSWSSGQNTQNISGLAGNKYYWLTVTDANGCSKTAWTYLGYNALNDSCYCTVTGTVYHDMNGNCIKDAGETPVNHILINNNNTITTYSITNYMFSDTGGQYSFILPTGNYNLQEVIQYMYPPSLCQSNNNPLSITASSGCTYTVDFANAINPLHDIHIFNSHITLPVPGNNYVQLIAIENDGTIAEDSIQFGYAHDGQMPFVSSSGITLTQPNAGLAPNWYNNTSTVAVLNPGQWASTFITYAVPTNIPLGTVVNFWDSTVYAAPMSNWLTDYSPWNNVKAFDTIVVGSFDPNMKEVSPHGLGSMGYITSNDTVLDYVIHFQNTGTWPATKIVVVDTLDADLNWESLKPGYSNHNYTATMDMNGVVSFTFNNINLPPASAFPIGSIGVVAYSIHTKKNLAQGTQFTNSAAIYFDYNPPIITNTTINTINDAIGVAEIKSKDGQMILFPNPAGESCTIKWNSFLDGRGSLEVYDMQGSHVMSQNVEMVKGENTMNISLDQLRTGLYVVRVGAGPYAHSCKLSVIK